jgi:hypothetical protein
MGMRVTLMKTGSFVAVDDKGQEYVVNEWTLFEEAADLGESTPRVVSRSLYLDNGAAVDPLSEDTWVVKGTGVLLRRRVASH